MTDLIERAMRMAARLNQSDDGCDNYDGATIDKLLDHVEALEAQLAEARAEPARIVAWIRAGAGQNTQSLDRSTKALFLRGLHSYADRIEAGAYNG